MDSPCPPPLPEEGERHVMRPAVRAQEEREPSCSSSSGAPSRKDARLKGALPYDDVKRLTEAESVLRNTGSASRMSCPACSADGLRCIAGANEALIPFERACSRAFSDPRCRPTSCLTATDTHAQKLRREVRPEPGCTLALLSTQSTSDSRRMSEPSRRSCTESHRNAQGNNRLLRL
jgi:hypothetical protein